MQVMMIGEPNSGKTTFMAGMYKEMTEEGGFTIRIHDENKRRQLEKLGSNLTRGIYPSRTDIAQTYHFDLLVEDIYIFDFEWYDYRGGLYTEYNPNSREARELDEKCETCDAMIVFIDSTKLLDKGFKRYWRQLKGTIERFACTAADDPKTLSIVFTKCDMERGYNITDTEAWGDISSFLGELCEYQYLHGLMTFSHINRKIIFPVVDVFMWTMRLNFLKQCQACIANAAYARSQSAAYNPNLDNIAGAIGRFFNGETPKYKIAEIQANKAEALGGMFAKLGEIFVETAKEDDCHYILF